jgi:3-oxoacyl-[acyl-carrier-protein] synthase-1
MTASATNSYLNQGSAICAMGSDAATITSKLFDITTSSPLTVTNDFSAGKALPLGVVKQELAPIDLQNDHNFNTRNNQLLQAALQPLLANIENLKTRYGAHRIGVIIGSSTSGIKEGEAAIAKLNDIGGLPAGFDYSQQEIGAPSHFVANYLGLSGPAWTISTACTSSAKALASAARLINIGAVDAVITGGCDSLCKLTVEGFSALAAVSDAQCMPFSQNRNGINVGEGAALFIMSKQPAAIKLSGVGETSDAHHISAPHPAGEGAQAAMRAALTMAKLTPDAIGYINLHGTATEQNDRMEALAVNQVFGIDTPCSSTKPLTGHTLGAAGALEAYFCWLTLQQQTAKLPPQHGDGKIDPELACLNALGQTTSKALRYAMSNSCAFGGNNISLILEKTDDCS